jgi:hypothetical protein
MGLWLWEDVPPMTFALADERTEISFALIRAGAWDEEDEAPCEALSELSADVIDLAAVRAARECRW